MSSEPIVVLWIAGPPGVGKTTTAWEVWSRMTVAGIPTAYVNIDQLGMCMPAPADDPHRHGIKAGGLAAVVPVFQAAGARCVVLCGVVDGERARSLAARVPGAKVVLCQLRLDHDELRERLVARGWESDQVDQAMDEAAQLDRIMVGDFCIDTTGLSVDDVIGRIRDHFGDWPGTGAQPRRLNALLPAAAGGSIFWLCGATGVGKSTIGWEVFMHVLRSGAKAAFIDLEQVGFLRPAPVDDLDNHELKARSLAAMWETFHVDGAQHLVIVGAVDEAEQVRRYIEALPHAEVTVVRLHAGHDELFDRIMQRGRGKAWRIPGDRLKGKDPAVLREIAAAAAADAVRLAEKGIGDVVVDTDGRSIHEITKTVLQRIASQRISALDGVL